MANVRRMHQLYALVGTQFRRRRMALCLAIFGVRDSTRIVDLGGGYRTWEDLEVRPSVLLVNINAPTAPRDDMPNVTSVRGDATDLQYADDSFDLVFANSVIEHLSSPECQERFAAQVRRLAPSYWIQTPNRRFPMEPHYLTPFVHWFPPSLQKRLLRNLSVWGLIARPGQRQVDAVVDELRLLNERDLARLFPDARILREKALGLTKSIIAVRGGVSPEAQGAQGTADH